LVLWVLEETTEPNGFFAVYAKKTILPSNLRSLHWNIAGFIQHLQIVPDHMQIAPQLFFFPAVSVTMPGTLCDPSPNSGMEPLKRQAHHSRTGYNT
jgi:hypothetical protein